MAFLKRFYLLAACAMYVSANPIPDFRGSHPDAGLSVPDLVTKYGYPIEVYKVVTDDDYILTMHRIPHGKENDHKTDKPVVFLMHGLLCSSADWVIMGPERGLAYILADLGYDVWMGNARGNTYSRAHMSYDPDSDRLFWKFSWNEIGNYDLPAMIDVVLSKTGQEKLSYVGHSQGTTSFYVMTSTNPEYNKKIKVMVALAPVAYMENIPNKAIKFIAQFQDTIGWIADWLGADEFLPKSNLIEALAKLICDSGSSLQGICSNILFLIAGFDKEELDLERLPVILSNTPAGAATMQLLHYAQLMKSAHFRKYDFGAATNIDMYGQADPPLYDLSKVTTPVAMFWGQNDLLTDEDDINRLHKELGNSWKKVKVPMAKWSHLDFLWAKDVKELLYDEVIKVIKRFK